MQHRIITADHAHYYGLAPSVASGYVLAGYAGFTIQDVLGGRRYLAAVPAEWDVLPGSRVATAAEVARCRAQLARDAESRYLDEDERAACRDALALLA